MAALAWLLIPFLAAIGAGLWGSWATRNRKTAGDGIELDGYARFRAAMERPEAVDRYEVAERPAGAKTSVAVAKTSVAVAKRPVAVAKTSVVLEKSSSDAV